ncbi:MAG: hypothetical protein C4B56_04265 [Candidatus Methanophagaceae archaeon]|nr:MAG: hypothetical protein C4B56_04265 [Methanophagales archaeon]
MFLDKDQMIKPPICRMPFIIRDLLIYRNHLKLIPIAQCRLTYGGYLKSEPIGDRWAFIM